MITNYHRPETLEEALKLLQRPGTDTRPLGGGTALNQPSPERFEVVDLQNLGLDQLEPRGKTLSAGATATLQELLDYPGLPQALAAATRHEASHNLRQAATIGGTLAAANGRSPLATTLLALDASLELRELDPEMIGLGDFLPVRGELLRGRLITQVVFPLNVAVAYEFVARTPSDQPLVCAAAARWPSGRVRVALGGFGNAPRLALDGPEAGGAEAAARSAYAMAGDEWASAEYRQDTAGVLAARCLHNLVQVE